MQRTAFGRYSVCHSDKNRQGVAGLLADGREFAKFCKGTGTFFVDVRSYR